jgi:hypothetical protein
MDHFVRSQSLNDQSTLLKMIYIQKFSWDQILYFFSYLFTFLYS